MELDFEKKTENTKDFLIYDKKGKSLKFSKLFQTKKSLIIFISNMNWFVCRDYVEALGKLPFSDFYSKNYYIYVIGPNPYDRIESFAKETNFPVDYLYVDPKLNIYKELEFKKASNFFEIKKGKRSKESKTNRIKGMLWACWKSLRYKNGDIFQFGGYVIGENEKIISIKFDNSVEEHASIDEFIDLIKN